MKPFWCLPLAHFCSNTDLDGWPRSVAGVLRAAAGTQELVCGPLGGWLCWGRVALGWCPQDPGSCRRGPRPGRRGCSAGPQAQGRTHSLAGSGPRPRARLQSGPRCTAERRPLSGRRGEDTARFLVAKAWCAVPRLLSPGEGACWDWCPLGVPDSAPAPLCPQTIGMEDGHTLIALLLNLSFQGEGLPFPGAYPPVQARVTLLTRAPGGAQGTLLAPGLAILAAAFCVGGAAPMQGLAAHIIGDPFPADVHVNVVVRQVLWWHSAQRHMSFPAQTQSLLLPHHSRPTDPCRRCCSRSAAGPGPG